MKKAFREYLDEVMKINIKTIDDLLYYEDDIVHIFKSGKFKKMGGNGPMMALYKWIKDNKVKINLKDDDIDKALEKINFGY